MAVIRRQIHGQKILFLNKEEIGLPMVFLHGYGQSRMGWMTTLDQRWYTQFRIGRWENGQSVVNEGSQFPNDENSIDQFFRQMTPDTGMTSDMGGDFDNEMVAKAVAVTIDEVYERTGKNSILVTHSQGGGPGWTAANYTEHIAAIIAIEPGGVPGML